MSLALSIDPAARNRLRAVVAQEWMRMGGFKAQAALPGDGAGGGAHVVQMVVALFELVLQCHRVSSSLLGEV